MPSNIEFKTDSAQANGLSFSWIELGSGPLVLALHGFPDLPRTCRYQMQALAQAGYRDEQICKGVTMLTETVTADFARQLEFAEINAWADQWEAIPEALARQFQMGKVWLDDVLVLTLPVIQFPHFNRVMGLGLTRPATEKGLDGILALFRSIKVSNLELHHIPHTRLWPTSRQLPPRWTTMATATLTP